MDYTKDIQETAELALAYAEDGAFQTAAARLESLAERLRAHGRATEPGADRAAFLES